jgi:YHS domain-containing protein
MAIDPVCKMEVAETDPPGGKARYWGQEFSFCSPDCRAGFQRAPQKYVSAEQPSDAPSYDPRMFLGDM